MTNCFSGTGGGGASLSLNDIRFKVKDGFSGGTIEGRVKKRLEEILSNPEMNIDTKLSEIRSLDQTIPRDGGQPILQINVDIDGAPQNVSVSSFYDFQQTNCEKKFDNSSDKAGIAQAGELLDELKAAGRMFQDDLSDIIGQLKIVAEQVFETNRLRVLRKRTRPEK